MIIDFENYIFLVRNLRGVYAPLISDDHDRYVEWLVKRYKYRDLGLAECLLSSNFQVFKERLEGNPFHVLGLPTAGLEKAVEEIIKELSSILDSCLAESLALSLVYASPLYLTSKSLKSLEKAGLVLHTVKGAISDLNSARLHMRIASYSILDYYVASVKEAVNCVKKECSQKELLTRRKKFAEKDSRRYWRVLGKGDDTIIAYIDHVHYLLGKKIIEKFTEKEERVLLAMPIGFMLDSAIKATK